MRRFNSTEYVVICPGTDIRGFGYSSYEVMVQAVINALKKSNCSGLAGCEARKQFPDFPQAVIDAAVEAYERSC